MSVVSLVLRLPHTIIAILILICLLGIGAALRMPLDIFPEPEMLFTPLIFRL